jgi:predicted nucleic acid-binding protein
VNGVLLDTNVLSETVNPIPDPLVSAWIARSEALLFISVISIGEIRRGVELLEPGKRKFRLENWLDTVLPQRFGDGLLPVSRSVADQWGKLDALRRLAGRPLDLADGLIAATALVHGLAVATRNTKDFEGLGLSLINPWQS